MKNTLLIIVAVLILGVGVWAVVSPRSERDTVAVPISAPSQEVGSDSEFDRLASLALVDGAGAAVTLDSFRGTPLVINSWAVWCPFCRAELADFAALQKEFDEQIVVIAIDRQESQEKTQAFTDELGITNDMHFFLDPSDSFYRAIGGFSMPETIFVNADGAIVVHKRGPMDLTEMRRHTKSILQ